MTGPLTTVEWLAGHLGDDTTRVVDTRWYLGEPERGRAAYDESHIPGAVYADLERHLSAETGPGRHPLPEVASFTATLGALGIGPADTVVAYDDRGGAVASRLWWMMRAIGHARVSVLDGGLEAWRKAGMPEDADRPKIVPVEYPAGSGWYAGTIRRDSLLADRDRYVVLDARSGERYRGESEPIDPVAGHIPGALNAPFEDNLRGDGRFLSPASLAARFEALGAGGDAESVVYCGSGVTACHNALAMEIAGLPVPKVYPGSWSDWSSSGYPVAVGPQP